MSLHHYSIKKLSESLQDGQFSAEELTQHFLNRIDQFDAQLNACITHTKDHALAQAKQADKRLAEGDTSPLLGIPIAHKDIFCTQHIRTTCASKMLDNFVSPYNATLVEKLNAAGTVTLAKLNMDEFAMGSSTEHSFYGPSKNPWDLKRTPGGSSGGSSSAVAAGLCVAATGSDTGGSIRQPSALCGLTGLKPTYGRVSRYGMIAFASSFDQAGPMAHSAEDAAYLLQAMAGADSLDSTSVRHTVPNYLEALNHSIHGMTVGVPEEFFNADLNPDMAAILDTARKVYESLGVTFKPIRLPHVKLGIPTYYVTALAECSSNLSRYDGVRYGYRAPNATDLESLYTLSRTEGFGDEVKRRILIGTFVLSSGYYDAYYLQAQKVRRLIAEDYRKAFESVDAIFAPTTPGIAPSLEHDEHSPVKDYLSDIFTVTVNLAGLPAITLPCGFHQDMPVGLQWIGKHFDEPTLLALAHHFQKATDWHQQRPKGYFS